MTLLLVEQNLNLHNKIEVSLQVTGLLAHFKCKSRGNFSIQDLIKTNLQFNLTPK